MPGHLRLFGFVHLFILAAVPLAAGLFAVIQRRLPPGTKWWRYSLAVCLFLSSAMYYGYLAAHGSFTYPDHLPLDLCDASLYFVLFAMLTLNRAVFDIVYYTAVAGASMSLLTPNLTESTTTYLAVQFFLDHGLVVGCALYLVWSGQMRPRRGSVAKAMLALNVYAALIGTFDAIYKTDYMFLCAKPLTVSLLTYLGPWPWYILSAEGVAVVLFTLLYLPFRKSGGKAA